MKCITSNEKESTKCFRKKLYVLVILIVRGYDLISNPSICVSNHASHRAYPRNANTRNANIVPPVLDHDISNAKF